MSRAAERVLILGLGALLMRISDALVSVLLLHTHPISKQPQRRKA